MPQPNYTVNTLAYLQEKYPKNIFSLIMGEDNLNSFHKWKNYEVILQNHDIFVYPRIESRNSTILKNELLAENHSFKNHPKIHLIDAPIVEISATFIRDNIKNGKNVQPLLPHKVWEYLAHNMFYQK